MRESRSSRLRRRSSGQTAAVDAIAELGEHCRQHGQRAEHRDADDEDRADRHGTAVGHAHEEHAGERDHHGQARDEHRVAARGRCGLEGRELAGAARPLLALALEVEERVVDRDGHADQHHQDLRALAGRDELARDGGEPEGREHRRQAEQDRDAGREQRAEREQQDDQRDRDGEELRLLEVLRELVVELLAGRGVAELLDAQARMVGRDRGHGRLDRGDLVGRLLRVAADVEVDEGGAAVLGTLRGLHVGNRGEPADARAHITCHGVQVGGCQAAARGLHEDHLAGGGEAGREGLVEHLRGAAGFTDAELGLVERVGGHEGGDRNKADHDECQPAENRGPRMRPTPAAHAVGEVALAGHKNSPCTDGRAMTCQPSLAGDQPCVRRAGVCRAPNPHARATAGTARRGGRPHLRAPPVKSPRGRRRTRPDTAAHDG